MEEVVILLIVAGLVALYWKQRLNTRRELESLVDEDDISGVRELTPRPEPARPEDVLAAQRRNYRN